MELLTQLLLSEAFLVPEGQVSQVALKSLGAALES